ncbi:MAG: rhomboid family intramembrane serine protease [Candidatus Pacearchaeota archaeon]
MKIKYYSLWLCLICIGVFTLQNLISGFTELFVLNNLAFGEYWRFLTAIFLHGSLAHLLYNLFALALFGFILEKTIGSNRFLVVFFLSGIVANIISVNYYDSSLGASGAIMGIIGCLAIIRPLMMVWAFGMPMPMILASVLWIAGDLLGLFIPSNVGHIAHLSGVGVGILIGFLIRLKTRIKKARETINIPESYIRVWEDKYMR